MISLHGSEYYVLLHITIGRLYMIGECYQLSLLNNVDVFLICCLRVIYKGILAEQFGLCVPHQSQKCYYCYFSICAGHRRVSYGNTVVLRLVCPFLFIFYCVILFKVVHLMCSFIQYINLHFHCSWLYICMLDSNYTHRTPSFIEA